MRILGLDLSKSSTGWCIWDGVAGEPRYGSERLGSEYTSDGQTFAKLHVLMHDLWRTISHFDYVAIEAAINPAQLQGNTTIQTIRLASGLAAHAHSFAYAMGCKPVIEVNVSSWRPDFIGKFHSDEARRLARAAKKAGNIRASARDSLKALTMERCRQLGLNPRKDDEGDAIGILTYTVLTHGETPPWIANEVLRQPLGATR